MLLADCAGEGERWRVGQIKKEKGSCGKRNIKAGRVRGCVQKRDFDKYGCGFYRTAYYDVFVFSFF